MGTDLNVNRSENSEGHNIGRRHLLSLRPLNMIHFWTRRAIHNHGKGSVACRIGRFLPGGPKKK